MNAPIIPSILRKIDELLGEHPEEPKPKSEAALSDDAIRRQTIAAAMDEMRKQLQRMGAAFGAGATLLLAGLGYAQLHEVFPLPAQHKWLTGLVALLGIALALVGAVMFAGGFFRAQRRILITPTKSDPDIKGKDDRIRKDTYARVAVEESTPSIEALELRARRFERLARASRDEELRAELQTEAIRLTGAYRSAMYGSAGRILERRSRDVFRTSSRWALATVLGIAMVFGAADYSKGERSKIALFKACQEAVDTGADEACSSLRDPPTKGEAEAKKKADAAKKAAEDATLAEARRAFSNTKMSRLDRLEACSKVLGTVEEQVGPVNVPRTAILNACLKLVAG